MLSVFMCVKNEIGFEKKCNNSRIKVKKYTIKISVKTAKINTINNDWF